MYRVIALYHFVRIDDPAHLQSDIREQLQAGEIKGTILVAGEGVNGTVAGGADAIESFLNWLKQDPRFTHLQYKESWSQDEPFHRTKVKLKKEIVTMGVPDIDPNHIVGTYVKPEDWNELISDPDVLLIDTRNEYEVQIGTFEGAINPHTETFREFPDYVSRELDSEKHKKVAMFCTGGIRCEKSTAYLKSQGFDEVYHLEGGILKYLEEVQETDSLWRGECFVFDDRVTVNHQLEPGHFDQCHACRMPITEEDKTHEAFEPGISCHHCIGNTTDAQRARFREREKQIQLSKQRGETHIGGDASRYHQEHREQKQAAREAMREATRNPSE